MEKKKLINKMKLEKKAGLCSGADFWHTKEVERLNVHAIMVSDGPHGLRKQDKEWNSLGINDSIKAVCFPTGCTVASSFDRELIYEMGRTLGNECQAEGVAVILGPAVNIKRSPLCGRNFEYFSEDPYLSSTMAASQINGIQSQGVGTSIKHFLANNQEYRRLTSDSRVDERTLREIYLASFENAVKEAKPWTVMCSYNKINGTYASENRRFLTEVLRDEWDFDGFVVSDWGAVNDRVEGVKAGLDLEMPSSGGINDAKLVTAVKDGVLDEKVLDTSVERILNIVEHFENNRNHDAVFDRDADHEIARRIAGESMVLLKNEGILPLKVNQKIAFIGEFAIKPRFQGGGSSHINSHKISNVVDSGSAIKGIEVIYSKGYDLDKDEIDAVLINNAVEAAKNADVAVVFAGLPDSYECEGYDRRHMKLPESHNQLIEAVTNLQPNTVVVLHNGSPVEMPWVNKVKGILEAYLAGQAVGDAIIDILFGDVNPSGKLAETFPIKLEDNPSFLYYTGEKDIVEYREGVFVGYRYYETKKMDVLFPFGHGLSYTTFTYDNLILDKSEMTDQDELMIKVTVTNTGDVFGKEVVQLYVTPSDDGDAIRPVKELKGYEKVALNPGESREVEFILDKRSFAYFNTMLNDWYVEQGNYGIEIGASSRDARCYETVFIKSTRKLLRTYSLNSTLGEIQSDEKGKEAIMPYLESMEAVFGSHDSYDKTEAASEAITEEMKTAMMKDLPLRTLVGFAGGSISMDEINELLKELNR
ncbi:glycoside hydrolase family 3 C-terminal domain-containing protein [Vallitalea maricola]|uniref:Glycoside hydrolase family 3 C-terminal domain-containing protein n=1 Tax=Vallitalea maricola TaxID=3074433 RepID=A0ACB5UGT4_9FIRM|nr:glycoside hydrolase family 3 C-terminal domain-containing protein [Vallitalea sp. AN17-2]